MNANNSAENNTPQSTHKVKRKSNKWTFWPSFLLLLFTINIVILLLIFIFVEGLFDKVSSIVPAVWGAFTIFITFLGIKKAKETTWLNLFKQLPTGMIIGFYTLINILLVIYLYLTGVKEHNVYITATLNDKPQSMIEIFWQGELIGKTRTDGRLIAPHTARYGNYNLVAKFGSLVDSQKVYIDWMWPFDNSVTIPLLSKPINPAENGMIYIRARIGPELVNGVNIFIDKTGAKYRTPDTLKLSTEEHTLKAEITRNGKVYKGDRTVDINAGPNPDIIIELSEADCLPKTLIINAEYDGSIIDKSVTIIINKDTLKRKLPATLSGLRDKEFNIEVLYMHSGYLFKGTTAQPISLNCGETKPIKISLK